MKSSHSQIQSTTGAQFFGTTPLGQDVYLRTIRNQNGMELSVADFGATITRLKIPVNELYAVDVVLGFESIDDYMQSFSSPNPQFMGAVVGPFAGRINQGKAPLNGEIIQLETNAGLHHLHGGSTNLSNQLWRFKSVTFGENPSLTYTFTSAAGAGNYPGILTLWVTYQLLENNTLKVTFKGTTTADTFINLTQHSYFNLNGHDASIHGMQLQLYAPQKLETTPDLIPTGNRISVRDTAEDFMQLRDCPKACDTTFILSNAHAATLYSPKNQLRMDVFTNQPAVHVYVGGDCFDSIKGKEQAAYHSLSGICFETQKFPDAPNHPHFPNTVVRKGEPYLHETLFQFQIQ
ncbi:aldose epimerase family protein [Flavobacterium sp.]|uniref:aldose epimerase family protein n=1 Tax=Flavobacterium sp. TaxID=239 RepID=UPI0026331BD2|nr:aldose epimerase family protein [Flavobacterium sp.]